jgi:hypothetical protein
MKATVRPLTRILNYPETYNDLPIVFEGSVDSCHDYCRMFAGYTWKHDSNVFGGYYVNYENGDCLLLV